MLSRRAGWRADRSAVGRTSRRLRRCAPPGTTSSTRFMDGAAQRGRRGDSTRSSRPRCSARSNSRSLRRIEALAHPARVISFPGHPHRGSCARRGGARRAAVGRRRGRRRLFVGSSSAGLLFDRDESVARAADGASSQAGPIDGSAVPVAAGDRPTVSTDDDAFLSRARDRTRAARTPGARAASTR